MVNLNLIGLLVFKLSSLDYNLIFLGKCFQNLMNFYIRKLFYYLNNPFLEIFHNMHPQVIYRRLKMSIDEL